MMFKANSWDKVFRMLKIARKIEPTGYWYVSNESGSWVLVRS